MNAFSQTKLENLGLETPLQEILNLQGQHIIETHASLIQYTDTDETTDKGITLEETLRVLVVKLEQLTGSMTNPQACCGTGCSRLAVVLRGPAQKENSTNSRHLEEYYLAILFLEAFRNDKNYIGMARTSAQALGLSGCG